MHCGIASASQHVFDGKHGFEGWIKAGTLISLPICLPFKHLSRSSDFLLWNMVYLYKKKCVSPLGAFFLAPIYFLAPATQATEDGAFALLFCPHPGEFDSSRVLTPGNLPSKAKQMPVPGGQPGRGGGGGCAQLESTDAFYQKLNLWQGSIWWKHVRRKQFSKWDFVQVLLLNAETQLQKLKMQVSFCHPSQRNKRIKMWESHPNDYWVFCKISDLLSLTPWSSHGPPLSKIAAGSNFLPWGRSGWQIRDFKI